MLNLRNKNFISPKMQGQDIKNAFGVQEKGLQNFIYKVLIENGYLRKVNQRYYEPTEKLWALTLPKELILEEWQARYLSYNQFFAKSDLNQLFDNEQVVKQLIKISMILLQKTGAYVKSSTFEEALAEGDTHFSLAPVSHDERR